MKKLRDIRKMIQTAEERWSEIERESKNNSVVANSIVIKKENLKNLIEDIRSHIEAFLDYSRCSQLLRVCKVFLEKLLLTSEKLDRSYAFLGYQESYYILDTIEMAKN